jgi:flagellar assembly protein FliH
LAKVIREKKLEPNDSCKTYSFTDFTTGLKATELTPAEGSRFSNGVVNTAETKTPQVEENHKPEDESEKADSMVEEAFTKGMEQGRSEIRMAFKEKVDQSIFALQTAIEEFNRLREKDLQQMEAETVRLALAIIKKVIGIESSNGEIITHVVKQAMQKVSDPRSLTLRINPSDMKTVKKFNDVNPLESEMPSTFQLEEDETILQGGCIIETKLGNVDARIDRQIEIIEEQLLAHLPELKK